METMFLLCRKSVGFNLGNGKKTVNVFIKKCVIEDMHFKNNISTQRLLRFFLVFGGTIGDPQLQNIYSYYFARVQK